MSALTPCRSQANKLIPASIVPNWNPLKKNPDKRIDTDQDFNKVTDLGYPDFPLPHTKEFWDQPRHNPQGVAALSKTQGYALPVHWTEGEMNRFAYPPLMVAHNDGLPSKKRDFLGRTELGLAIHQT